MKKCIKCLKEKPIEEFYAHAIAADKHSNRCKECDKARTRAWSKTLTKEKIREYNQRAYKKNKKKINAYNLRKFYEKRDYYNAKRQVNAKKYRELVREEVFNKYGGSPPKCECCGEKHKEFFTIDHIDNNGTAHRKSLGIYGGFAFYCWLRKNNFPDGYQVLCMNCNLAKGFRGGCPHLK